MSVFYQLPINAGSTVGRFRRHSVVRVLINLIFAAFMSHLVVLYTKSKLIWIYININKRKCEKQLFICFGRCGESA
jgi:hypothetical protein